MGVIRFIPTAPQLCQGLRNRHTSLARGVLVHGGETEGLSKGVSIDPDDREFVWNSNTLFSRGSHYADGNLVGTGYYSRGAS